MTLATALRTVLALLVSGVAAAQETEPEPLALWYRQPAARWEEALPVGNGRLGAMVFGGVSQVGQYDVVVINRGDREGLEVGNVMAIYKRGSLARDRIANEVIRLPSERAGLLMVFRTFEKLAYGLVLMTERPLAVSDEVRNP